jgi:hypothetical protein
VVAWITPIWTGSWARRSSSYSAARTIRWASSGPGRSSGVSAKCALSTGC